jgi:predicted neuraminidase
MAHIPVASYLAKFALLAKNHSSSFRWLGGLLACVVLLVLDLAQRESQTSMAQALWPRPADFCLALDLRLVAQGQIPMPAHTPAAHASSLLALPTAHPSAVLAFWFAGTRESAADVRIAASQFDRVRQRWSAARFVVDRAALGDGLGFAVRRLGNPVGWLDVSGRVHLFVVATGLGGWAAARIVHLRQKGRAQGIENLSFEVVRVLPLSWLWNTSFLVRTAPLPLKDGGMVLPVHFELGIKYPVALRFDANGEFLGMVRISNRRHLLQPTFLALGESHWLALMRNQQPDGKVAVAGTTDGGQNWSDLPDLALNNPDSSVASLALAQGQMLLVHNSSSHDRTALDLSTSADGKNWSLMQALKHGAGADEFSYPALAWSDDSLWLAYTDQRRSIAWQRFSFPSSLAKRFNATDPAPGVIAQKHK